MASFRPVLLISATALLLATACGARNDNHPQVAPADTGPVVTHTADGSEVAVYSNLPPLAAPRGVNTDVYMRQEIAVIRLQLDAMNRRFERLQQLAQGVGIVEYVPPTPMESVATAAPMPVMPAPLVEPAMTPVLDHAYEAPKPAPAVSTGVSGVRVGGHADYVRIVLDARGSVADFTTNLDNTEKLLTVELPSTPWKTGDRETFRGNGMVSGYTAEGANGGSVAVFTLTGSTKIVKTAVLSNPTRLVIDLAK